MTFNKKHSKSNISKIKYLIYLLLSPIFFISNQAITQESYKLREMEINRAINLDDKDNFEFPTNPFEIVDRIRRANSMSGATTPSDAIDDAIKSFDMIKEDKQI